MTHEHPHHRPSLSRAVMKAGAFSAIFAATAACQTTPVPPSGYLSSYDRLAETTESRNRREWRDDSLSDAIAGVYIHPSTLELREPTGLTAAEEAMVLHEVDRQICYEVSERFTILSSPAEGGAIRTAVVSIRPTSRVSSAATAVAGVFIPVPFFNLRAPGTAGGLAAESELLAPDGRQAAVLLWTRNVEIVDRTDPSMSPVGDALQLAEPFGDAVADAFSSEARQVRDIPDPDPCAHFGPRRDIGRLLAGGAVGAVTGLYVPEVVGAGTAPDPDDETAAASSPDR